MYQGETVFFQLMEFLPRWMFWLRTAAVYAERYTGAAPM